MSGFVVMHREALEHPMFAKDSSRLGAWLWLVAAACWKPTRIRIKGEMVDLDRGELSFSVRFLAESWGWSKSRVDRFLADLRAEGMIAARSKNGTVDARNAGQGQSILTICNYAKYQDVGTDRWDNSGTSRGTTAGQQRDKEEQGNKGTIEEEPIGSSPPHSPPCDFEAVAKAKKPKAPAQAAAIPDWIPVEAWQAFLEMRKRKGARPTDRAVTLLIGKLDALRKRGHDPGQVLDQSTLKNWTDVYEIKDDRNGNHHRQAFGGTASGYRGPDRRDGFERALDRAGGFDQPFFASAPAGRPDAGDGADDRYLPGPG